MATGTKTFKGLAVPLYGESTITQITAADDTLTIKAASTAPSGRQFVITDSAGTEKVALGVSEFTRKFAMGTIALASLASNAGTGTVTVTGLTTNHVVMVFANVSTYKPNVYVSAADTLAYNPMGALAAVPAMTVNYLAFLTA